jgi:hypothetical protein
MQRPHSPRSLIEPSVADLLAAIEVAPDLTVLQPRHRACSLRVIAKALGRPPVILPARWTALRQPVSRLHHGQLRITAKTLANHKANVRAALSWFAKEENLPSRGAPLSPDWTRLRDRIGQSRTRAHLSSPMRYWSAIGITAEAVDEAALDACMAYRAATTALKADAAARRRIARAWNRCAGVVPGWPSHRLIEPPPRSALASPVWEAFPAGLRTDIENYLSSLRCVRRVAGGRRRPPCKPSTIKVRRAKLLAFVRKAVSIGLPIDSLASFRELVNPALVERVFASYWKESGEQPSVYLIELASLLLSIGRETNCLNEIALAPSTTCGRYSMSIVLSASPRRTWRSFVRYSAQTYGAWS